MKLDYNVLRASASPDLPEVNATLKINGDREAYTSHQKASGYAEEVTTIMDAQEITAKAEEERRQIENGREAMESGQKADGYTDKITTLRDIQEESDKVKVASAQVGAGREAFDSPQKVRDYTEKVTTIHDVLDATKENHSNGIESAMQAAGVPSFIGKVGASLMGAVASIDVRDVIRSEAKATENSLEKVSLFDKGTQEVAYDGPSL